MTAVTGSSLLFVFIIIVVIEKTKAQRGAVTCSRSPRVFMARWAWSWGYLSSSIGLCGIASIILGWWLWWFIVIKHQNECSISYCGWVRKKKVIWQAMTEASLWKLDLKRRGCWVWEASHPETGFSAGSPWGPRSTISHVGEPRPHHHPGFWPTSC